MKKKLIACILVLCLLTIALSSFTACFGGNQEPIEKNFSLKDGRVCIQWEEVEGCAGYRVYKSNARYGKYTTVDEDIQKETVYYDDDIYAYYRIVAVKKNGEEMQTLGPFSYDGEVFGDNVYVYSAEDNQRRIQNDFHDYYKNLEKGQFSSVRFAALFKEGDYSDVEINVGYYTTVSGLSINPANVTLGKLNVVAENSLCNFWRGAENLTVGGDMTWAVSQATFLRRIQVQGDLSLSNGGYTSGGFLADSNVEGVINSGSQQQWLSRNFQFNSWQGGVYNMVFVGAEGDTPSVNSQPVGRYTVVNTSETVQEKPFLTFDEQEGYRVFVPERRQNEKGVSWDDGSNGEYIPLDRFYVARSDRDTADTINAALSQGKNLLFTPGIYNLDKPLSVTKADSVIIGLGLATLKITSKNTDTLMRTADVDGLKICGLLFDAGEASQTLLEVGESKTSVSHAANPICLSDLYFRVGGVNDGKTSVNSCVIINANNVLGDNFWVWRADHDRGVGWDINPAQNGIIINGDNVTFYGLFVEHFLEYQTVWNGNNGCTYFYQSELPYDVPNQNRWKSHDGTVDGYASYKIADEVQIHRAYGLGVYSYLRDSAVRLENAIEAPTVSGIHLEHIITVWLSGNDNSGINHVINGMGGAAEKNTPQARYELYSPS